MALNGSGGSRNNNNGGRNATEMPQETLRKGPWTEEEDKILKEHVTAHGEGNWTTCRTLSRLMRCGKSCRLRWLNHLRPNLKKGAFSKEEEAKIVNLHAKYGSKWSLIACQLPGRSDNEIKNYWNTRVKRLQKARLPIYPNGVKTHQASNLPSSSLESVVPSLNKQAQNPTNPAITSIYDIFKPSLSRKTIAFPNSSYISQPSGSLNLFHQNNGLSYEQNGAANSQMQVLTPAELFAPMTAPTTFGNIGAGDYVSTTPIEAVNLGKGKGVAIASSSFTVGAATGSHIHASIEQAAALPRETNQVDDDFLNLLRTPALTMSMNDWFDKDGSILPSNDHTSNFGGW